MLLLLLFSSLRSSTAAHSVMISPLTSVRGEPQGVDLKSPIIIALRGSDQPTLFPRSPRSLSKAVRDRLGGAYISATTHSPCFTVMKSLPRFRIRIGGELF